MVPKIVSEIWEKYGLQENVRRHCIKVMEVSMKIAERLKDIYDIDFEALRIGALLHDIGRSITHGIDHFVYTGEILRKEGLDEKIVRIAERHFSCGITREEAIKLGMNVDRDFVPERIEEKIVCMADNLVRDREEITFDEFMERLQKLKKEFPETSWFTERTIERALKMKDELKL